MAGRRARAARPERRPDPEPLEVDESLVIAVGSGLWFAAWLVMFVLNDRLEDHGNEWYLWTAAAGLGLGVWGWWLVRKRVEARKVQDPEAPDSPAGRTGRRRRAAD